MMKTTLLAILFAVPTVWGVKAYSDAVVRHDNHVFKVAACMNNMRRGLDMSAQEAYLICERQDR